MKIDIVREYQLESHNFNLFFFFILIAKQPRKTIPLAILIPRICNNLLYQSFLTGLILSLPVYYVLFWSQAMSLTIEFVGTKALSIGFTYSQDFFSWSG